MKEKSLKNYFNFYISICVLGICSLAAIIYGYYNFKTESKNYKTFLQKNIQNILPSIQNYLWEIDYEHLKTLSNIIFNSNPNICEIKILNEFGNVIIDKKRKEKQCADSAYEFKKEIFYKNKFIGKIILKYSFSIFKKELIRLIFVISLIALILALSIIIFVTRLYNNIIAKNITPIINNLELITSGNYNTNFKESEFKELNEIIKNLNLMIQEIRIREKRNTELNEKLNILINSIPVGLFIFNEKGDYIQINDTVSEMLKMDKKEILSKTTAEYSTPDFTLDKGLEILERIKKEGSYDFEWKLVRKDGEILDVIGKGRKISVGDDTWIIIVLSDITYLKKLEKEVIKKEKLESLGILAGGIAHDFNNILTSLGGSIELIEIYLNNGDIEKAKEKLKNIQKSLNRAKSLTLQLLTFSKGGAPIKKKFKNLSQLIKDTVDFVLSGSAIEVFYDFDKDLKPVKIDPDQISLAIENIILNAKEALNNRGKIEIKVVNSLNFVKISIKDYGPGIPEKIKEKIWEPYFSTKSNGTGLGLSIVYSIITKHNGEIKVYSEEGKYTDFQIFLPVSEDEDIDIEKKEIPSKKENIKRLKILVMEDEDDIQDFLKELFTILGYEVDFAKNGEQAVEMYKSNNYDVVLLDLTIKGGMGGEDCIKELLKIEPDIKAIVYSGYSSSPVMQNFKKFGFKAALKKPFTLNDLKKAIEDCIYC